MRFNTPRDVPAGATAALLAALLLLPGSAGCQSGTAVAPSLARATPPVARRIPKADTLFGDVRVDDYYWLRQKTDSTVLHYIAAENEWTAAGMRHTEALQEQLYREIVGRTKQTTDVQAPVHENGYWYYARWEQGKNYRIYARRKAVLTAPEEIIFDQNAAAAGRKFHALWALVVSPSGRYLATLEDTTALRDNVMYVKDLSTGRRVDSLVSLRGRALWSNALGSNATSAMAWANDERTLLYLTADSAKRANAVWRHEIGTPQSRDVNVFQEDDGLNIVRMSRARTGQWIFISADGPSSEWRAVPTAAPTTAPRVLAPRRPGVVYAIDHGNGYFFRLTNDGAQNFRVLRASDTASGELRWEEWLPTRDSAFVEQIDILRNFAVVTERARGLRRLRVTDLRSNATHYVEFPEVAYDMHLVDNRDFESPTFRVLYSSFVTPHTWYDYDPARRTRIVVKQREINGFSGSKYEVRRILAPARDGVQVPVSLVLQRGTRLDGKNPLVLRAYGSYGVSTEPFFDLGALSLVDRGFVYAIAHVRGGAEMGPQWYEDGKMLHKRNTFTDFIDVAGALIKQGYTSPDRLVANGGSAGGLLMGAVANMRPDLFRAIVADVPAVDLLNTLLNASLSGATQDPEYGNPHDSVEYAYMRTYSPYDNVTKQAYPWMLVTTALNDSQVMYWEPTKWVAKLRAFKTDANLLYLRVNYAGGHWGSSGISDQIREGAFRYAFMLDAVGLGATKP